MTAKRRKSIPKKKTLQDMRIGIFGTFDAENYGDLLFPLLAERRLRNHFPDLTLDPVSPVGGPPVWGDCPRSIGYDEFSGRREDYQGFLVGGGNIIRVTPSNLETYNKGVVPVLGYANLWAGVAAKNDDNRLPICWNAPGVPTPFPSSLHPLLRACLERVDYLSVRDDPSRDLLKDAVPDIDIAIVPDPAWEIDALWTRDTLDAAYRNAFALRRMAIPDRSVAIHPNSRYLGGATIDTIAAGLDDLCRGLQAKGILIAIGPCHGDDALARTVAERMTTAPLAIDHPRSLKEVAACISRSVAYVGSSMHGFITASSFCVPAVIVASPGMIKFPGLLSQIGLPDLLHLSWPEAIEHVRGLASADHAQALQQVHDGQQARLDAHWSKITALFQASRQQQSRRPETKHRKQTPRGTFGVRYREAVLGITAVQMFAENQSLRQRHKVREAKARDLASELQVQEAQAAERDGWIASLNQVVAERDGHIAGLHQTVTERDGQIGGRDAEIVRLKGELGAALSLAQNKITALETEKNAKNQQIKTLEEKAVRFTKQLSTTSRRIEMLVEWIEGLEHGISALLSSRRWKTGNRLGEVRRRLLRRPRVTMPVDILSDVFGHFNAWKKNYQKEAKNQKEAKKQRDRMNKAIAEAEAAFRAKDWSEAVKRWQVVLDGFGENESPAGLAKLNISVARRLSNIDAYKRQIAEYVAARATRTLQPSKDKKIVIYTAISGNYDAIKLPERPDSRFDYVLFTDTPAPDTGIYQVRPITYLHVDPTRAARFVKTHPHMLLEGHNIAIWIDSNITIVGDIFPFVEAFLASGKAVAAVPHPLRKSIYEELEACIARKKEDAEIMREQLSHYRSTGFDSDDLIESGLTMFNLRDNRVRPLLNAWWREIDRYSKRDQLSLNYALKQTGVAWHRLTEHPNSVRNHPVFAFVPHDSGDGPASKLIDALQVPFVDPYAGPSYADIREQRITAQKHRRIDIVLCVHNALEDVKLCLESIRRTRSSEHQRLIIIDDGSDQPTARYLEDFARTAPWIELHRNRQPRGYPKAANQGLAASTAELVILLNSDTIVTDGWAEKMADAVFSTPGAGLVGPMSNAASHQSIPEHRSSKDQTAINELPPGLTAEDMNRYCEQWTTADVLPRVPLVHGFCFGVTREVINRIGFFDEGNFPKGYGEENDYCFRAADSGFSLVVATHTYIFHTKSKSYATPDRVPLMKAGSETLKRLYGRARIERAVRSMQENPIFVDLRERTRRLTECAVPLPRRRTPVGTAAAV